MYAYKRRTQIIFQTFSIRLDFVFSLQKHFVPISDNIFFEFFALESTVEHFPIVSCRNSIFLHILSNEIIFFAEHIQWIIYNISELNVNSMKMLNLKDSKKIQNILILLYTFFSNHCFSFFQPKCFYLMLFLLFRTFSNDFYTAFSSRT